MCGEPEYIEINTDDLEANKVESVDLWKNRQNYYNQKAKQNGDVKVSIYVQAYNQIDKLRYAIECLLKYTPEDLYELFLIDNGSEPEVMELFKTVKHPRLKIFRFTKNLGATFPNGIIYPCMKGKYFVAIGADIYVTKNWLTNLLECVESDDKIGIAAACSSYSSNQQEINVVNGKSREEIQAFAEKYNIPDPKKWHQDIRIVSVLVIIRTEIQDIVGITDPIFFHDFGEDDYCMRIRRAGYKVFICRDTFVYHDHPRKIEDNERRHKSLQSGHDIFVEKWDVEPWDDILYQIPYNINPKFIDDKKDRTILCIDPRLGKPILNISNYLNENEKSVKKSYAYSSQARFYLDLTTVADETYIGAIENIRRVYNEGMFDIICLCEPLNTYLNPLELLKDLTLLLSSKGTLFFHIDNLFDVATLFNCFNIGSALFPIRYGVNITVHNCNDFLAENGFENVGVTVEPAEHPPGTEKLIRQIFQSAFKVLNLEYSEKNFEQIKVSKYHFFAIKD